MEKSKLEKSINRIVLILQLLTSVGLIVVLYLLGMFPDLYLILGGILLLLLWVLSARLITYKKPKSKRSIITQCLSVVLSILMVIGSGYLYKINEVVNLMTGDDYQTQAVSVIVLNDSEIKNQRQLPDKKLGYVSFVDEEMMNYAIEDINKNVGKVQLKDEADFDAMIKDLKEGNVDAILLDEGFRSIILDQHKTFTEDTRVIYQVKRNLDMVSSNSVDITKNTFVVYISGNDEYGDQVTTGRSDVNMVCLVNPVNHQVLLISVPRDTYFPLHRNGKYDKFTHAGIYGLNESISTLEDMIGCSVNYYARLNFTSFIKIIDALGGIEVYSPVAFTTIKGKYKIKEGINNLTGKQALSFVRERKALGSGDFARGQNQQRMISAIIKKMCTPAILTKFNSVLDAVSGSIKTNMSQAEMNALVKLQLSDMPSWDIQSIQVTGKCAMKSCYSMGMELSVVVPYESSLKEINEVVDKMLNGEKIETKMGDLNRPE